MFLDKLFSSDLVEYNKDLILDGYKKDRVEIEQQLVPPICTKIRTETIAKMEEWSKELKGAGLKEESQEAHNLALNGCAAYWINLLGNYGPDFDGEAVLSEVLKMEKKKK